MINVVFNFGGRMSNTQAFIAHIVIVVGVIGAAIALCVTGHLDSGTAVAMIAAVAGISLGAVVTTNGATVATNAQAASNPVVPPASTTTTTTTSATPVVVSAAPAAVAAATAPLP
jgi:hypothetical protein